MRILIAGEEHSSLKYQIVAKYQTDHYLTCVEWEDAPYAAENVHADAVVLILDGKLNAEMKSVLWELKDHLLIFATDKEELSEEEHIWILQNFRAVVFHKSPAVRIFTQIESLIRFRENGDPMELVIGDLTYDRKNKSIRSPKDEILLPRREYDILEILLRNKDVIVPRDKIALRIYGFKDQNPSVIESHVSKLRGKIRSLTNEVDIQGRRFMGYRLYHKPEPENPIHEVSRDDRTWWEEFPLSSNSVLSFST